MREDKTDQVPLLGEIVPLENRPVVLPLFADISPQYPSVALPVANSGVFNEGV